MNNWLLALLDWIGRLFSRDLHLRLNCIERQLDRMEMKRGPIAVYVMITWPGGLLSHRVVLHGADIVQTRFVPEGPVPKGAWVAVLGDACITDVCVGNQAQLISHSSETPFCITQDAAEIGNQISVRVKGNRT